MISVLLNWMYILFTTFCLGYGFTKTVEKRFSYSIQKVENIIFSGLVIATVYAQIVSIFLKVALEANILLVFICILILFIFRKDVKKDVSGYWSQRTVIGKLLVCGLVLLWAYFTSIGYMHYDSDLYHAQSIRWIEEYGVVKGLGNLHNRLAYNSSIFAVSALYSMKFMLGQSLHTVCGFMALLLNIAVLDIFKCIKNRKLELSDYIRIAALYYLTLIYDEIIAPASDYAIMCTVFLIVLTWAELTERKEKNIAPYALLCVGCVYAISLKLTAGLILILMIKPAYVLLKQKKIKDIFWYIGMGCVVICPWIVRNVIISGYLIYPFPAVDIFSFKWKIDPIVAAIDAAEIKTWGRGLNNAAAVNVPITEWIGNWFNTMISTSEKLIILADVVCILVGVVTIIVLLLKRKWEHIDWILMEIVAIVCYLFWQTSAPLFRYGYAYTLLLIVLTLGFIQQQIGFSKTVFYIVLCGCILKISMSAKDVLINNRGFTPMWQLDYIKYEVAEYEIEGETIYYPVSGDRIGYDYFPASITKKELRFLNGTLKSGFCVSE